MHFNIYDVFYSKYSHQHVSVVPIVKPTRCTNVSNLFYFGMTLYMFQTDFPSITRSSRLYIEQQAFVKQILLPPCYIQQQACGKQVPVAVCTVLNS